MGLIAACLLLVGGACSGGGDPAGPTTTTSTTTTTTAAPTTTTVEATTTEPPPANPLTDRIIGDELLELMPLRETFGALRGFAAESVRLEDNAVAVARLPSGSGETGDIARFGRLTGYRTVLRPARFTSDSALAVDTWVVLFGDDAGAAGYLDDFAGDAAKGEDSGHGADLRLVGASDFVVDEVADEAVGLVLRQETVYGESGFNETLIGFRLGRLLGFVSVLRADESDVRVPTLFLAQDLERRMLGVLDGRIVPIEEPEPAQLAAYRFSYSQTLTESYLRVVYPELPPVEPGNGSDPGGDTAGGGDPGGSEGDAGEATSSTSSTTTTTTTLLVPTTDITSIDSEGAIIVATDAVECTVRVGADPFRERNHVIQIGRQAWRSSLATEEGEFEAVEPDEEPTASDLIYCPGWDPSPEVSGIDLVATPGLGRPVEWEGDRVVQRFDLDIDAMVALGLAREGGGGLELDEFTAYLDLEGPWVVGIDLSFRGTSAEMEAVLGPGFRPRADVTITVKFRLSDINDPTITVDPPDPDSVTDARGAGDSGD